MNPWPRYEDVLWLRLGRNGALQTIGPCPLVTACQQQRGVELMGCGALSCISAGCGACCRWMPERPERGLEALSPMQRSQYLDMVAPMVGAATTTPVGTRFAASNAEPS